MITLDWKPDKQDKTPIYRQIVKDLNGKSELYGILKRSP